MEKTRPNYKKLEEYGIIGNLDSCALVANDGSIDWACFPNMESPSVFAKLLDVAKGGCFSIHPAQPHTSRQSYIENTNVLRTHFENDSGSASIIDFMPIKDWISIPDLSHRAIYRKVECTTGAIQMSINYEPKPDYAKVKPVLRATGNGLALSAHTKKAFLQSPVTLENLGNKATGKLRMNKGDALWFVFQYGHDQHVSPDKCDSLLKETINFWSDWRHKCDESKCVFGGPWHDKVVRSALVLKLLANLENGAIYAAPTTSIPEVIGGVRNWDYRYSWIRDSAFTLQALYNLGHTFEANNYMEWLLGICSGFKDPSELKIMYGVNKDADLKERILERLSGYENSAPVRIGNKAASQTQLDVFGELVNAVYEVTRYGESVSIELWDFVETIVNHVCEVWNKEDSGIWEIRDQPRHFVNSKLACWVAVDRGIKMARMVKDHSNIEKWNAVLEEVKKAILEKGFNSKLNSFTQNFDSDELDAACLLIPIVGFLPIEDERVQGTIDATLKFLTAHNGLVYRYKNKDGLPGDEGTFLICSFWLVNNLALSGRISEAEEIYQNILKFVSPLGLLSEEIDPDSGRMLGNFPQAFSHIGLINSALYIGKAKGFIQMGPEPIGE